jgi:hypothetical protein
LEEIMSSIKVTRSLLSALAVAAALFMTLAPNQAAAELFCKCAYPSLSAVLCRNTLTAQIKVRDVRRLRNGNRVYLAEVQRVFRGDAARLIWIEAPATCGFEFRNGKRYAVSINLDATTGRYTTSACGSFVSEWSQLSAEDRALLAAPTCEPSCDNVSCEDGEVCMLEQVYCIQAPCPPQPTCVSEVASEGDICYRFVESDAALFVDRECAPGLSCMSTDDRIGFNSIKYCVAP